MLLELRVENLLLIERAELRLEPGLNVITGETGAGKTVLANALDLLLGGKPRAGAVRPGASEAYVEGVFSVPDGLFEGEALAGKRAISVMGDGGFWHNGLTSGIAHAVFNRSDNLTIVVDNNDLASPRLI